MPKLCMRRKTQHNTGGSIVSRQLGLVHRSNCCGNIGNNAASRPHLAECTTRKTDAYSLASLFRQKIFEIACTETLASCVCSTRELLQVKAVSLTVSWQKLGEEETRWPFVVSEPLENRGSLLLHNCGTVDVGRWHFVTEAQTANQESLIQQHGCRSVLRDLQLASTPQQASAAFALYIGQYFFCLVSHNMYAGAPTFRVCDTPWGVIPFFME